MPTLTSFLLRAGLVGGLVFAAMLALATLVSPFTRPMQAPVDPAVLSRALDAARAEVAREKAEAEAASRAEAAGTTVPGGPSTPAGEPAP
ncbi:hypothetical protein [Methylobrevis pamukkalensis]|nr:hypothetical protein [Methylobrevis pamukkalensis]